MRLSGIYHLGKIEDQTNVCESEVTNVWPMTSAQLVNLSRGRSRHLLCFLVLVTTGSTSARFSKDNESQSRAEKHLT